MTTALTPENTGSDNRIYRNSTQCVQNRTEQLVVNAVFDHASCIRLYVRCKKTTVKDVLTSHRASCAHEPCGKVSVLPDLHRQKQQGQAQKTQKNENALFYNTKIKMYISHIRDKPLY